MHQRDAAGAADVDRTIVGSIIPFAETKRLDSFCSTPCLLKDGIAKECVYLGYLEGKGPGLPRWPCALLRRLQCDYY